MTSLFTAAEAANMAPENMVTVIAWAVGSFMRLLNARRRHVHRRKRLRHMALLLLQTQNAHPTAYCKLNQSVPILRMWFDVESELRQDFRISRRSLHGLQRLLQRYQDHGWGSEIEVLIYVYWLAHGLGFKVVSRVFGVPKTTVHRVVHRVAKSIWKNLALAIRLPRPEELEEIGQGFGQLSGTPVFNCVVGAIDCCHFPVKPPSTHINDYLNSKGSFSVKMQAICDSRGRFLDIFVGYPGSVHDTCVMQKSPIYRTQQYPPQGHVILGDSGYPCLDAPIRLITPYEEPVGGSVESHFNSIHSRGRGVVEKTFAVMKTRWRSTLLKATGIRPSFLPVVIATCAFLHNVCLDNEDTLEPDDHVAQVTFDPDPPHEGLQANERSGNATRDELAALMSGQDQR